MHVYNISVSYIKIISNQHLFWMSLTPPFKQKHHYNDKDTKGSGREGQVHQHRAIKIWQSAVIHKLWHQNIVLIGSNSIQLNCNHIIFGGKFGVHEQCTFVAYCTQAIKLITGGKTCQTSNLQHDFFVCIMVYTWMFQRAGVVEQSLQ